MDRRFVGSISSSPFGDLRVDAGDRRFCERIVNEPLRLVEVVSQAGDDAEVVIEATCGW